MLIKDPLKNAKILIIEDEPDLADILREELSSYQASVEIANRFEVVQSCLGSNSYNIIICDLQIPGGGGLQLLELIRSEQPQETTIYVSTGLNSISKDSLRELRVTRVFEKPFNWDEFINTIIANYQLTVSKIA